jgi:hypothetical protein
VTSKAICFPHRKTTLIGVFRSNGRPSARSHLRSLTVAPPEPPRSTPNPQTTTNMLSLIPKMGKRPAGCAKRPLFPAESGNKLISNPGLEVLRGGSGGAGGTVRCRVGGIGGQRFGCLGRQSGFGWIAEMRGRWIKGQSRGTTRRVILHASPVTIPSERAMNWVLLSKGMEINYLCSSLREMVPWADGWLIIMSS